jgi:hypothetical protein
VGGRGKKRVVFCCMDFLMMKRVIEKASYPCIDRTLNVEFMILKKKKKKKKKKV